MPKLNSDRWKHPLYKQCFCYNREGIVYTSVFTKRQSTSLAWNPRNKNDALTLLSIRFHQELDKRNGVKQVPTLHEAIQGFADLVVSKLEDSSKSVYVSAFKAMIGKFNCNINDSDAIKEHIQNRIKKLSRSLAPATLNMYITKIIALLNFCVTEGLVTVNPINSKYKVKNIEVEPLTYSIDELERICEYYADYVKNKTMADYIRLLTYTGMRANECLSIRVSDIEDEFFTIIGKGNKKRIFPYFIAPQVKEILFRLKARAVKKKYINIFYDLKYNAVHVQYRKVNQTLFNENERTLHTIRKAVSSIWRDKNMPVEDRCNLLGHNVAIETKIYNRTPDLLAYQSRLSDFTQ